MAETTNEGQWIPTTRKLPKNGVLCDTISAGGIEQQLRRKGLLWFLADMSMYVYYEVTYWRDAKEPTDART